MFGFKMNNWFVKTVFIVCLTFVAMSVSGCGVAKQLVRTVSMNAIKLENVLVASTTTVTEPVVEEEVDNDWSLILVNPWNPVPEGYEIELVEIENGYKVDSRIYTPLKNMLEAARADGMRPYIYSAYRSESYQKWLFERDVADYMEQGFTYEQADAITRTWVAYPGTSEHQLGLALDITSENVNSQPEEVVWQWLRENAHKYGFILRYTREKMELTGINPEPWHYRYVGEEAAKEIYEQGVCLEEYLENKNLENENLENKK